MKRIFSTILILAGLSVSAGYLPNGSTGGGGSFSGTTADLTVTSSATLPASTTVDGVAPLTVVGWTDLPQDGAWNMGTTGTAYTHTATLKWESDTFHMVGGDTDGPAVGGAGNDVAVTPTATRLNDNGNDIDLRIIKVGGAAAMLYDAGDDAFTTSSPMTISSNLTVTGFVVAPAVDTAVGVAIGTQAAAQAVTDAAQDSTISGKVDLDGFQPGDFSYLNFKQSGIYYDLDTTVTNETEFEAAMTSVTTDSSISTARIEINTGTGDTDWIEVDEGWEIDNKFLLITGRDNFACSNVAGSNPDEFDKTPQDKLRWATSSPMQLNSSILVFEKMYHSFSNTSPGNDRGCIESERGVDCDATVVLGEACFVFKYSGDSEFIQAGSAGTTYVFVENGASTRVDTANTCVVAANNTTSASTFYLVIRGRCEGNTAKASHGTNKGYVLCAPGGSATPLLDDTYGSGAVWFQYNDTAALCINISGTNYSKTWYESSTTWKEPTFQNQPKKSVLSADDKACLAVDGAVVCCAESATVTIDGALVLTPTTAPANPWTGTIYVDDTDGKAKCYSGGIWNDLF